MAKANILYVILLLSQITVDAQSTKIWNEILNDEKSYFKTQIPTGEKKNYKSVIQLAQTVRPKVIAYIKTKDSSFFGETDSVNIIEGYSQAWTHLYGYIWKSDTAIYKYDFNWTQPVEKSIKKVSISQLEKHEKDLVSNFADWGNPIFSHIRNDMYTSSDGVYFFGSKYKNLKQAHIRTIAFYQ